MAQTTVFKFLDSYAKEDGPVFFGREAETDEIYQRCSFSKTLVVYGKSGTGKTSIIRCGLGNAFDDQDWLPVFVRRSTEINRDTIRAIRGEAVSGSKAENSLSKEVRNLYLDHFKPVYLIFDQFEELFIFGGSEEIETFFASIKTLIESDQDVHLIFVIREEYLAYLTEAEEVIPEFLENRIRIEHLTAVKLRETVEKMCEAAGIELEDGFSEELTERMTSGKAPLELSYLQVYLDSIRKKYPDTNRFSKEMIEALGSFGDVLGDFLQRQLNEQPDPAKAETVLKAFVSAQGTKRLIDTAELKQLTAEFGVLMEATELDTYVNRFIDGRILRQVGEDGKYELRHDTLAKVIYERITLAEKELLEAKQFVHNAYNRFQKNGTQLRDEDLDYLAPYAKRLYLKDEQKKFLNEAFAKKERRQKRKLRLTQIGVGVLLLLLIGAGYLLYQNYQDNQLQARIDESHRLAKLSKSDEIGDSMLAFLLAEKAHQIHEGPHTHNALLEAYDRGLGIVRTYHFKHISTTWRDSIITIFSEPSTFKRLNMSDLSISNLVIDVGRLNYENWHNYSFYSWGFTKNEKVDSLFILKNNAGDTLSQINKKSKRPRLIRDYSNQKNSYIFKVQNNYYLTNTTGQVIDSISRPKHLKKSLDFVRNDSLFVLTEGKILYSNIHLSFSKFKTIPLNHMSGTFKYDKSNEIVKLFDDDKLTLIDAKSFKPFAEVNLSEFWKSVNEVSGGYPRAKESLTIRRLSNGEIVILPQRVAFASVRRMTPNYSVIYESNKFQPDIIGAIQGEIIGVCGEDCYLIYSEATSSIYKEKRRGKLFEDLVVVMRPREPKFKNVKIFTSRDDEHLLQRIDLGDTFFGKTNSVLLESVLDDGDVKWSLNLPYTNIFTKPLIEAASYDSTGNALALVKIGGLLIFLKVSPEGDVIFEKRIHTERVLTPFSNEPQIVTVTGDNYLLILDDRLYTIQCTSNIENPLIWKSRNILKYTSEALLLQRDSTIVGLKIDSKANQEVELFHIKQDTLELTEVHYYSDIQLLQLEYLFRSNANSTLRGKVRRNDFYLVEEDSQPELLFSRFQEGHGHISIHPLKDENYLGSMRARYSLNDSTTQLYLFNKLGISDSIQFTEELGDFKVFDNHLYACGNGKIIRIDVPDLEIDSITKNDIDNRSIVHALSDSIPLIVYRNAYLDTGIGFTEYVNSQGLVDTIEFALEKKRIDSTSSFNFTSSYFSRAQSSDLYGQGYSYSVLDETSGIIYVLDNSGVLLQKINIPINNPLGRLRRVAMNGGIFLWSGPEPEVDKLTNSEFEEFFSFQRSKGKNLTSFVNGKYLLTSHRLLNQYELFPINGEVAIEMVREQGRLGKVRDFTEEEIEKYQLN